MFPDNKMLGQLHFWPETYFRHIHSFHSFVNFGSISGSESRSVMSNSLWPHGLYSLWSSPGQNTRVGSLSLLKGIFPTQGLNPGLLHCRCILYQLSRKGSPRILEWVDYPFSSTSSQPRNQTGVSCIAGGLFTNWAVRPGLYSMLVHRHQTNGHKIS